MTDDPSFDDDIRAYVELDAKRADIQIQLDVIKARIRERGVGTYTGPNGIKVSVTPNRRFDPVYAAEILPKELIPLVQATKVDPKLAKANLPPVTYEQCMREVGDARVSFR